MSDTDLLTDIARWNALGASIASRVETELSGAEAVEALPDILAGNRQGDLITCLLIGLAERSGEFARDGAATINAFVCEAANESRPWASKRISLGRALVDRLPQTLAAWGRGDLGLDHAAAIADATKAINDLELVADLDRILAEATPALSPSDLRNLGAQIRDQHLPAEKADKDAARYARQQLSITQLLDGTWVLRGQLDAEAGTIVSNLIESHTPRPTAEQMLADPAGALSPGARRAQALLEICRLALEHEQGCTRHGGGQGTLVVTLPLKDLQSGQGTGTVAGGRQLPAAALRRWACDSGIVPLVLGGESEILDFGRRTRVISTGLRLYVAVRDGGCIFPGCDRPSSWCEVHHRTHWVNGGQTKPDNLHMLCATHHHLLHEGGWRLAIANDPDKTAWFHPPGDRQPLQAQTRPLITTPQRATESRPAAA